MENYEQLLKQNQLSVTEPRMAVLKEFFISGKALTHSELEKAAGYDRVTIYRTLQTFVEKGIVHQIPSTDNTVHYALCKESCEQGHHHDNHVHFVCERCSDTICLDDVTVPKVQLPEGFQPLQSAMIVKGICGKCR